MKPFMKVEVCGIIATEISVSDIGESQCAKFSVVVDRKNAESLREKGKQSADFFACELWDSTGKRIKFLTDTMGKGSMIFIKEADMHNDEVSQETAEGIGRRTYFKLIVNEFMPVTSKKKEETE